MPSRKQSKKGIRKGSKKSSKKGSKKGSRKGSRKGSKKGRKKGSRKVSKKGSKKGSKGSRKGSRKGSKKVSKKGSRKGSKKGSRKGSKKGNKGRKGSKKVSDQVVNVQVDDKKNWKKITAKKSECLPPARRWTPASKSLGIAKGFCEESKIKVIPQLQPNANLTAALIKPQIIDQPESKVPQQSTIDNIDVCTLFSKNDLQQIAYWLTLYGGKHKVKKNYYLLNEEELCKYIKDAINKGIFSLRKPYFPFDLNYREKFHKSHFDRTGNYYYGEFASKLEPFQINTPSPDRPYGPRIEQPSPIFEEDYFDENDEDNKVEIDLITLNEAIGKKVKLNRDKCKSEDGLIWIDNKGCFQSKIGPVSYPDVQAENIDLPFIPHLHKTAPTKEEASVHDCLMIKEITNGSKFPIVKYNFRESYFVCDYFDKQNKKIIRDSDVLDWISQNKNLVRKNAISLKARRWFNQWTDPVEDFSFKTTVFPGRSVIEELSKFKIDKNLLLFRGIGFNKGQHKMLKSTCLDKIQAGKQYEYTYKDYRYSSWTLDYETAESFAKEKHNGFIMAAVFHPDDILVDFRLLCDYAFEDLIAGEMEVVVKPGIYKTRIIKYSP